MLSNSKNNESISSMSDTILKDIRDHDENEIYTSSPNIHERTLNSLTYDWSMCDIFEINESEGETQCVNNKENETDLQTKVTKQNIVTHSQNVLNETNSHWQDNKAFTQLDPCKLKDNILDCFQVTQKYENCFEKTISTEIVESMHMLTNEQQNIKSDKLIKRNSDSCSSTIQHKVCCLDNQIIKQGTSIHCKNLINNDTFYGLPNKVKELFLQIRGINSLYQWQDECLNLDAVKNRKNLIYALPTSGGKTLVAEILMLQELICNKRNAIFILPFVAIVQEKVQAMTPFALELNFLVEEYAASKGTYPPKKRRKKNSIYMCTIEKALSLINSLIEENRLNEIGIIVIDELHLLGESGGRGATLEVLLTKILYVNDNIHIVAMSATIGNLDEIATFLNAELYTGNFRPVEIKEYVKCEENIWLLDFTTEELLTDVKKINYQYSNDAAKIDPDRIGGLVMDVIPENSCLIFCSSRKNCENVALLLSRILFKSLEDYKKVEKENLLNALKSEEGLCSILHKTIKVGVAYHHSGLTSEERRLLEDAFKAGILCVICCTSTLATGVNLPARRVILRSPYVGNQFLNLSRYKQMVGRAGRAGMGNIGESILICKNNELEKVTELLRSKMDDSLSTIHVEKDRGINNLILSAILLRIATTRLELHKIAKKTLLNIQQKRLNVNIKQIVDETLSEFIKASVMKIKKEEKNFDKFKPNISVAFPSQDVSSNDTIKEIKGKRTLKLTNETELELCSLGRAAMKACINMQCAYTLYKDLKKAQEHLILIDYLHLLYLVTPYDLISQIKLTGSIYYDVVTSLSETQMKTARLIGINEANIGKIRNGLLPKDVEPRVIHRFYVTLILYDLWSQHAVYAIAEKYEISRGIVQNLLTAVSSFASSVIRFCQELDEFWAFKDLLNMFSKRLSYCCPLELEALMDLPLVKIGRARQLYNAGFRTVQIIAKAQPTDLQNKIPYLSKKTATQIIAAAKLQIVEKLEDLKEETQNILDGI
ncbi:helicase POLQ-like [Frieseomelitta varia]|uniref:helicase POLQ-like n=1 Tax=Frieseomelitta varia TaxID=561572 RepID=UPI001CB6B32E|nr:helicase POLQ-like [Frieseomelitta varia]